VEEAEVPELADTGDKALELARRLHARLATCSADLAARAEAAGVPVVNLRVLSGDLGPHHPVGEHLVVDLVKAGRQPRQAVGYLPDGDMVVVNDAAHLVGASGVGVVVAGTRPTTQGLLVFAQLTEELSAAGGTN
jgi:uncharacterized protein YacL